MATATTTKPTHDTLAAEFRAEDERKFKDHQTDLARRAAERDERCSFQERMKLLDPIYAAEVEMQKPMYKHTVEFTLWEKPAPQTDKPWYERFYDETDDRGQIPRDVKIIVEAQNEDDAWSMACDKIQKSLSRRLVKPSIKRGKQLNPFTVAAKKAT